VVPFVLFQCRRSVSGPTFLCYEKCMAWPWKRLCLSECHASQGKILASSAGVSVEPGPLPIHWPATLPVSEETPLMLSEDVTV
jgi:hypothetical protein